jgi:arsenite methyltransferase
MVADDIEQIRAAVRDHYGKAATAASAATDATAASTGCCGESADGACCGGGAATDSTTGATAGATSCCGGGAATDSTTDATAGATSCCGGGAATDSTTDATAGATSCRGGSAAATSSCCGDSQPAAFGAALYGSGEIDSLPGGAVAASLGCGNPTALAELRPGQVVLDLGSGGGIDVLLSARRVAPGGKAYGVDMTPEMHDLARRNQAAAGVANAEFLLGTIENIPLPASSVDVVISNCVVNLSGDKPAVLREAFRVLRPGGRLAISDIVLTRPLPEHLVGLVALWTGCIAGAMVADDLRRELVAAGFADVSVEPVRTLDRRDLLDMAGDLEPSTIPAGLDVDATLDALDGVITSSFIRGVKPGVN